MYREPRCLCAGPHRAESPVHRLASVPFRSGRGYARAGYGGADGWSADHNHGGRHGGDTRHRRPEPLGPRHQCRSARRTASFYTFPVARGADDVLRHAPHRVSRPQETERKRTARREASGHEDGVHCCGWRPYILGAPIQQPPPVPHGWCVADDKPYGQEHRRAEAEAHITLAGVRRRLRLLPAVLQAAPRAEVRLRTRQRSRH